MKKNLMVISNTNSLGLFKNVKTNLDSFPDNDFILVKDTPLGDMWVQKNKLFDNP